MTQKYMTEEEVSEYQKAKQMLEDFSKGYIFPSQPQNNEKLTVAKENSRKKIARIPDPDQFDFVEEIGKAKEMIDKFESKFGPLTVLGTKSGQKKSSKTVQTATKGKSKKKKVSTLAKPSTSNLVRIDPDTGRVIRRKAKDPSTKPKTTKTRQPSMNKKSPMVIVSNNRF